MKPVMATMLLVGAGVAGCAGPGNRTWNGSTSSSSMAHAAIKEDSARDATRDATSGDGDTRY